MKKLRLLRLKMWAWMIEQQFHPRLSPVETRLISRELASTQARIRKLSAEVEREKVQRRARLKMEA